MQRSGIDTIKHHACLRSDCKIFIDNSEPVVAVEFYSYLSKNNMRQKGLCYSIVSVSQIVNWQ